MRSQLPSLVQISAANSENEKLRARIRDLESKVTSGLNKRESEIRKMEAKSAEEDEATKREVEEVRRRTL